MTLFRLYLAVAWVTLTGYTLLVGTEHGWHLLPVFFADIAEMSWPGQFNVDFMTFLGLSGIWVAWRQRFSTAGIFLGLVAFFGGMMFLGAYLLLLSFRPGADIRSILLGSRHSERQIQEIPSTAIRQVEPTHRE